MTKEQEMEICNQYLNTRKTQQIIADELGIHRITVRRILKKNNIERKEFNGTRKNQIEINENYFENIDSVEKATILGFIAADGGICLNHNKNHFLSLMLNINDIEVLEKIVFKTESKHLIVTGKTYKESTSKYYDFCKLDIHRYKICKDLEKWGIGRDKSINLKIPNINFKKDFIHGYFCGNGSWIVNRNQLRFKLSGPCKEFIIECRYYISEELKLNEVKIHANENESCWDLVFGGNQQCKIIFDWMYKNSYILLNRKFEKAKNHFESIGVL